MEDEAFVFQRWLRIVKPSTDTDIVFEGMLEKHLFPLLYLNKWFFRYINE